MQMTRRRLKSFPRLLHDIQVIKSNIEEMCAPNMDAGLGHSVIMDYSTGYPRPQAVVGFDRERYDRLRQQLAGKEDEAGFIAKWIGEIEDPITRHVFELKYESNMCWDDVARKMGYGQSLDYPRLHIHDRYLRDKKIK